MSYKYLWMIKLLFIPCKVPFIIKCFTCKPVNDQPIFPTYNNSVSKQKIISSALFASYPKLGYMCSAFIYTEDIRYIEKKIFKIRKLKHTSVKILKYGWKKWICSVYSCSIKLNRQQQKKFSWSSSGESETRFPTILTKQNCKTRDKHQKFSFNCFEK